MEKQQQEYLQRLRRDGVMTIPKKIREILALNDGDFVKVEANDNNFIVTPVKIEKVIE